MTRDVDFQKYVNYITKAENSLQLAKIALERKAFDSAVMNCVHSAINALDALTTFHLNKRASGSHTDVLSLVKGILADQEFKDIERQFSSLLSLKNASEYQPDLMNSNQAEDSIKWAERILNKVKTKLKS